MVKVTTKSLKITDGKIDFTKTCIAVAKTFIRDGESSEGCMKEGWANQHYMPWDKFKDALRTICPEKDLTEFLDKVEAKEEYISDKSRCITVKKNTRGYRLLWLGPHLHGQKGSSQNLIPNQSPDIKGKASSPVSIRFDGDIYEEVVHKKGKGLYLDTEVLSEDQIAPLKIKPAYVVRSAFYFYAWFVHTHQMMEGDRSNTHFDGFVEHLKHVGIDAGTTVDALRDMADRLEDILDSD